MKYEFVKGKMTVEDVYMPLGEAHSLQGDKFRDEYNLTDALKQYEDAIDAYSEVIEDNPQHARAYFERGKVRDKIADIEERIDACNRN